MNNEWGDKLAEIKRELKFGLDDFGKQTMLTQGESIAQMLVNLFLMRPGQIPSLPHIGMNIRQYMYRFENEIDISNIKTQISIQCPDILQYIDLDNIQLISTPYKNDYVLYLLIPLSVKVAENSAISIGFKRSSSNNEITFNYKINNNLDI